MKFFDESKNVFTYNESILYKYKKDTMCTLIISIESENEENEKVRAREKIVCTTSHPTGARRRAKINHEKFKVNEIYGANDGTSAREIESARHRKLSSRKFQIFSTILFPRTSVVGEVKKSYPFDV